MLDLVNLAINQWSHPLVVYVNDIVITGSDTLSILSLKSFFHTQCHTKDLEC